MRGSLRVTRLGVRALRAPAWSSACGASTCARTWGVHVGVWSVRDYSRGQPSAKYRSIPTHAGRLEEAGLPVTLAEVRALFDVFDSNNDDSVSCKELISKLYPPPPRPGGARARGACV